MLCEHCGFDTEIRNPSGRCDHLYHPDYCTICQIIAAGLKLQARAESVAAIRAGQSDRRALIEGGFFGREIGYLKFASTAVTDIDILLGLLSDGD